MARKRIEFWLDEKKPNEQWLLQNIPVLKSKWIFSRCMREGLELLIYFKEWSIKANDVYDLIVDLRAGNLDKLFSMLQMKVTNLMTTRTLNLSTLPLMLATLQMIPKLQYLFR